ncbi:hypothetical protein C8A00DRAFT_19226 [Chaetomidium leptoderma]|uniref:Uncharacterized protein n=1 Tax=Chaetomidium leptoderma TaxID=669021 RepID=A0AAN6ZT31_9PEZI|nr:hypothetical protein C8A00DRAFT_19226 [Chaetomidium leptoderma]
MFSSFVGASSSAHSGGKTHKQSSSHGSRRNNNGGHPKSSKSKSQRPVIPGTASPSFLFVVNELQVDYEPLPGDGQPLTDQWLNLMPPEGAEAYLAEVVGTVFRYENGVVAPAHGYRWHRPAMGARGYIVRVNQAGVIDGYPADYKTHTVFACSALLPMIVTDRDASLGLTFLRRLCDCDKTHDENYSTWSQLHFQAADRDREGISYVNSYASGDPFVAGKDSSWIPSLVPSLYRNTNSSIGPSRGLSGDLPIIIALMGFHGKPGRASDVFMNHDWHLNRWSGPARASNHLPKSGESPRGLLVHVCTDNLVDGQPDDEQNNLAVEQCKQMIGYLEYGTILVQG